jgi:hypothetical protein
MPAYIEIICISNEFLIGKIVKTNASWLAKTATSLGVSVKRITDLADTIEEISVMINNPPNYIRSHPKEKENKPNMELHLSTSGKSSENPEKKLSKAAMQLSALIKKLNCRVIKAETEITV